ncbi:MAG TPA: TolC family protein [Chitinophagaceae bacterium]
MKKTGVYIFGLLLFLFAGHIATAQGGKLSLKQAIETGIANNLDVSQAGLRARENEINWKQAQLNRYPNLNATASHGVNQGRSIDPFTNAYINQRVAYSSYGISSGVILFNGLTLQQSVKQTSLAYQASSMDWQQAKDNITIGIILAYLQVLADEDVLVQSNNQAALSLQQVERLEILNREGAIAPSLLSDLRGQYAVDQLAILNAQQALETSRISLSQLMNVPYDKNMQLERLDASAFAGVYTDTPAAIYETALKNFAQVRAAELRRQSAERGVKVAKGLLYPTLSLNGNANTNYSDAATTDLFINTTDVVSNDYVVVNGAQSPVIRKQDNYNSQKIGYTDQLNNNIFTSVSLNLRIPIFNSLQARNRVKLAKITLQDNELQAKTVKTQLQQSIEQAYINMTSAAERFRILEKQVEAFTESFRAAGIRFDAGLGTSVDYLTAKNNLDRANINLINARYEHMLRIKVLDYYQGKPLWQE